MPTYQYTCTSCGHDLEAVQSFSDDPLTQCPVCQGRLRKRFGTVGVVFKGSGFYRTDSRAASNGDRAAKDTGSGGDGSGGGASEGGKVATGKDAGGKDAGGKDAGGKAAGTKEKTSTS